MESGGIGMREIRMGLGTMTIRSMIARGMGEDIAIRFLEVLVVMPGLVMRTTTGSALVLVVLIVDFLEAEWGLDIIMRTLHRIPVDIGESA